MAKFKSSNPEQGQMIPTYLSDWIPEHHLVYIVSDIVDQLDLSVLTSQYTEQGEEAYHPALLLKILFYGYATGVFSSRKLREALDDNVPFRWLSGGLRPDHRTISDFRKNNLKTLARLFTQIVQIGQQLGYVSLGHVSIDGSKIKANASKHKAMSRERMKQEIVRLEQEIRETLEKAQAQEKQGDEEPSLLFPTATQEAVWERSSRLQTIQAALKQLGEQKPEKNSKMPAKDQINFTDADSRIMDTKTQGVIQGYNPQIAVEQTHGIIIGLQMSHSSSDQKQFAGVLRSIKETTGQLPEIVTADAGYFSAENIQTAETHQVDAYIAASREAKEGKNPYDKTNFTYEPETDTYRCPAGKTVPLQHVQYADNPEKPTKWIYECQECLGCDFRENCVKSKTGKRTISRTEADPIRESMRTKVQSVAGKKVYRLRKGIVEPVWGQIKACQGFRQFLLRGEEKVGGEFTLVCIAHNLRKIHSASYPKPSTLYKRKKSAQKRKSAA